MPWRQAVIDGRVGKEVKFSDATRFVPRSLMGKDQNKLKANNNDHMRGSDCETPLWCELVEHLSRQTWRPCCVRTFGAVVPPPRGGDSGGLP